MKIEQCYAFDIMFLGWKIFLLLVNSKRLHAGRGRAKEYLLVVCIIWQSSRARVNAVQPARASTLATNPTQ